jgi:hypothetical protein
MSGKRIERAERNEPLLTRSLVESPIGNIKRARWKTKLPRQKAELSRGLAKVSRQKVKLPRCLARLAIRKTKPSRGIAKNARWKKNLIRCLIKLPRRMAKPSRCLAKTARQKVKLIIGLVKVSSVKTMPLFAKTAEKAIINTKGEVNILCRLIPVNRRSKRQKGAVIMGKDIFSLGEAEFLTFATTQGRLLTRSCWVFPPRYNGAVIRNACKGS